MNPKSVKQARTGLSGVIRIFAYGSTRDEWIEQWDLSSDLPYALEVPVNEIHAVKVVHPFRTVDELRDLSVLACRRDVLSRTNSTRRESLYLMYSRMFPFGIHSEIVASLVSGVLSQRQMPIILKMFGWFNDIHNATS